jgi:hypothetical protein
MYDIFLLDSMDGFFSQIRHSEAYVAHLELLLMRRFLFFF